MIIWAMVVNHLAKTSSWIWVGNRKSQCKRHSLKWLLQVLSPLTFFSYMTISATYTVLPKTGIYFFLETRHKFGFSSPKENIGQTVLHHNAVYLVPSVALKGFMAPLTLVGLPAFYCHCQHQQLIIQGI